MGTIDPAGAGDEESLGFCLSGRFFAEFILSLPKGSE